MGNRTASESEIYANFRNRHEQNCLRDKLENLSEEESNSMDLMRVEMTRWRQFRQDNRRNSGWSAEAMRPSKREPSMISLNSSSQRFIVTGTQIDQFQRPWALSYKRDSHNHVYNNTFQSLLNSKPTLNRRQRSGKSSSMSKTSTSSSMDSSSLGAHRVSMSQKARSKSAWTLPDNAYRCPPNTPTKSFSSLTDMNVGEDDYQQYFDIQNMAPDMTMRKLQPSRSYSVRAKSACVRTGLEDNLTNATAKNREINLPIMVNNDELHSKVRAAEISKSVICPECGVRNSYKIKEKRSKSNEPHNIRSTFLDHQSSPSSFEHFRDHGDLRCLCSFRHHEKDHQLHLQWQHQAESTHIGGHVLKHNLFEGETGLENGHDRKSWKSVVRKPLLDVNSYQIGKQDKNNENNDFDCKSYKMKNKSPLSSDNVELHFSKKEEQVLKVNTDLRDNKRTKSKSKKRHLNPEDILASALPLWDAELPLSSGNSCENDEIHDFTPEGKHREEKSSASNVSNDFSQKSTLRKDNFKEGESKLVRRRKLVKGETSVKSNMADLAGCRKTDMAEMSAQHSTPDSNLVPCNTEKLLTIESHSDTPFSTRSSDSPKQRSGEPKLNGVDTTCNLNDHAMPKFSGLKSKQSHTGKMHRQSVTQVFSKSDDDAFTRISKTFKKKSKETCQNRLSVPCFNDSKIVAESMTTDVGKEKENLFPNNDTESLDRRTLIGLDIKIPTAENYESEENNDNAKPSTKPTRELISPNSIKIQASSEHLTSNNQIFQTNQNPSDIESINQTTCKHSNETKDMNSESKDMPQGYQPLTYTRANASDEGRNDNNTKTNNVKHDDGDKTTNKNKMLKNQNRPLNGHGRETTASCFPDTKSDDVYHKGVLLTNYVCPEQRYKVNSRRLDLRCRSGNRSHSFIDARSCVVRVHFSKEARQQALTKLVENNNSGPGKYIQKALTESLQARIKEFCISLDGYRQST